MDSNGPRFVNIFVVKAIYYQIKMWLKKTIVKKIINIIVTIKLIKDYKTKKKKKKKIIFLINHKNELKSIFCCQ